MKHNKFAILIAIILFIVPFFWLKPGEMNIGGDSGRLYFYDPYSYLQIHPLYSYIGSGIGIETHGYPYLPYTLLILLLKWVFQSPTILIAIFNGFALSCAFLSTYFVIKELLKSKENYLKGAIVIYASILGGLFYLFSQIGIHNGWENPIITHSQVFLNPLMFLLILRYFLTKKFQYLAIALFVTLLFAFNFSFVGAPPFFSFYPLATSFIFTYVKFIRKLPIPYKTLIFGLVLFLLVNIFHLASSLIGLFTFGSAFNGIVFAQQGELARSGLNYFLAIAANTKVSLVWMSLNQAQKDIFWSVFILFPLVLVGGLFFNKGKTLLLTAFFFLVVMFFASANITDIGLTFYKQLFKIPGFSMFRNFHGQWSYAFIFFYALFFGQALAIIASKMKKLLNYICFIILLSIIIGFGSPLLSGAIPIVENKDTGVRYALRMDPVYENVLSYFKKQPIDGKVMTFPLTGPGYQILQGKDGGVYQGLPTISYLAGKSEFTGYEILRPFHDIFAEAMGKNDFTVLKRLLAILNIRYIFYNSDLYIYGEAFKDYLYAGISKYSPKDQVLYKAFIEKLPITKQIDFGDRYHIYSVEDNNYLPHIFAATEVIYTNDSIELSIYPYFALDSRLTPIFLQNAVDKDGKIILYGLPQSPLFELNENIHLHRHEPYISVKLNDPAYPLTLLKENYELFKVRNYPHQYLDFSLYLLSKRIVEVVKFGNTMQVLKKPWKEPKIWEIYNFNTFNTWEASLTRYEKGMNALITWIGNTNEPEASRQTDRIKISEQLFRHEVELLKGLKSVNKKNDEKTYLHSAIEDTFARLFQKVSIPIYNPSEYFYHLPAYANREGYYELYLDTKDIPDTDIQNRVISIGSESLKPLPTGGNAFSSPLTEFKSQNLDENTDLKFTVLIRQPNLLKEVIWNNSGSQEQIAGLVTLTVNNSIGENSKGLMIKIPGWKEKKKYLISFDYLTFGDDFLYSFYDKKKSKDELQKFSYKQFFGKKLSSKDWKTSQTIISAEENSIEAFLQISAFSLREISTTQIKNLSITEIKFPQILFRKIVNKTQSVGPRIEFIKINPTKYRLDIKNASNPYTLVFLESFNPEWKLINPAKNDTLAQGAFFRGLGLIGKYLTGLFIEDRSSEGIKTEYLNGNVKEISNSNIFMEPSTFETWGKVSIAEKTHTHAFEYANAWSIKPEDMDGKSDYTLILEMDTQKQFYPALMISILTIIFLIIHIIGSGFRRHAKSN